MFRLREILEGMPAAGRPSLLRLANDAGLSYGTVHAMHANKATRVDLATLDAIAAVLELESPGELIGPGKPPARKRGRG